jgi:hypothetical protein
MPANNRRGLVALPQWPPRWHHKRRGSLSQWENDLVKRVELRGLEPLTPTLPGRLVGARAVR